MKDNRKEVFVEYKLEFRHKEQDFEEVYNIEKQYLEESNISSVIQIKKWDKRNNDTHIFVRCLNIDKIVGEITLLPINETLFNKFINDELCDTEISEEDIIIYKSGIDCYLLFSAIAIDKNYRHEKKVLSLLLEGLSLKIEKLFCGNVNILNMCSEGQTAEGRRFIEKFLNMQCQKVTSANYKLYCYEKTKDFLKWSKKFKTYISNYNKTNNLIVK